MRENSDGSSARPRESGEMAKVSKESPDNDGAKSEDVKEFCNRNYSARLTGQVRPTWHCSHGKRPGIQLYAVGPKICGFCHRETQSRDIGGPKGTKYRKEREYWQVTSGRGVHLRTQTLSHWVHIRYPSIRLAVVNCCVVGDWNHRKERLCQ